MALQVPVTSLAWNFVSPWGPPANGEIKRTRSRRRSSVEIKREPAVEGATISERMRKEIEGPGTSSYFLVLIEITESSSKG